MTTKFVFPTTQHQHLVDEVLNIAIEAGRAVLEVYHGAEWDVQLKEDKSPVTRADYISHKVIESGLRALGTVPVLSEESEMPEWSIRRQWFEYWLIDPLDGTREFIRRNGEFTVNIALVQDGNPVLGVVYAPVQDLIFWGTRNFGAFCRRGARGQSQQINSLSRSSNKILRIAASHSHKFSPDFSDFLARLPEYEMIFIGSSLKMCMVADGSVDLYPRIGPTSEWDTAAAQAVVEAAGGHVLDWRTLNPLSYNQKESLLNTSFVVCSESSYALVRSVFCSDFGQKK